MDAEQLHSAPDPALLLHQQLGVFLSMTPSGQLSHRGLFAPVQPQLLMAWLSFPPVLVYHQSLGRELESYFLEMLLL